MPVPMVLPVRLDRPDRLVQPECAELQVNQGSKEQMEIQEVETLWCLAN